jgi:hypothetical protein
MRILGASITKQFISFCETLILGKIESVLPTFFSSDMRNRFCHTVGFIHFRFSFKRLFSSDLLILHRQQSILIFFNPVNEFSTCSGTMAAKYLVSFFVNGCELGATKSMSNPKIKLPPAFFPAMYFVGKQ